MNIFIKNCLRIAGISIVLGIFLVALGYSMDNTVFADWRNYSIIIGEDRESMSQESWFNETDNMSQVSVSNDTSTSVYNNVKSLKLDISYGEVVITQGDDFSIWINEYGLDMVESTIEDGVLKINDKGNYGTSDNIHVINIFGFKIRTNGSYGITKNNLQIKITLPYDFTADNIELLIDAGVIKADTLTTNNAVIHIGAGSCKIKKLTVYNESQYSVDAGELEIDDINASDINLDCAVGSVKASGTITGKSYVNCNIGSIVLNIDGKEENYNYEVNCGIGSVKINNNRYSGINSNTIKNNNAENSFILNCDIGKIDLTIK